MSGHTGRLGPVPGFVVSMLDFGVDRFVDNTQAFSLKIFWYGRRHNSCRTDSDCFGSGVLRFYRAAVVRTTKQGMQSHLSMLCVGKCPG